jgi:hypothetical protein
VRRVSPWFCIASIETLRAEESEENKIAKQNGSAEKAPRMAESSSPVSESVEPTFAQERASEAEHVESQAVMEVDAEAVEEQEQAQQNNDTTTRAQKEQQDEHHTNGELENGDELPPATPSKNGDDTSHFEAKTRTSMEDPATFQDVELSENQQTKVHEAPRSIEGATSSISERPRSATASTANGSVHSESSRPEGPPVRTSRASSTYSARAGSISAASRKPLLQGVLVVSAFETILNSKDARRTPALKEATQRALDILKAPSSQASSVHTGEDRRREVLEPLKLACETKTNAIMITALDAIGKLVSYGFFSPPGLDTDSIQEEGDESRSTAASSSIPANLRLPDEDTRRLSDMVVDTICDCFIEAPTNAAAAAIQAASNNGPDAVNLQIVKALLTLVLQESDNKGLSIHQSGLVSADSSCMGSRKAANAPSIRS